MGECIVVLPKSHKVLKQLDGNKAEQWFLAQFPKALDKLRTRAIVDRMDRADPLFNLAQAYPQLTRQR